MSFLFGSQKQPTSTTQRIELPGYITRGSKEAVEMARRAAQTPYQPYGEQRFAGFTPDELRAFELAREGIGAYTPYLTEAAGFYKGGAAPFTAEDISSYINPFLATNLENVTRELQRAYAVGAKDRAAAAIKAGAFGGARFGIEEEEARRNLLEQTRLATSTLSLGAYQDAIARLQADREAKFRAAGLAGDIGGLAQQYGITDIGQLMTTGGAQRELSQAERDFAYQQFLEGREYPITRAGQLASVTSGVPYPTTTYQAGYTAGPSLFSQLAGAGLAAYGVYRL